MAKSNEKIETGKDKLFKLSVPFKDEDISWRIQRLKKDGTAGLVLGYINVRQVQDRLTEVMGTDWQCKHEVFGNKTIYHLGLKLDGNWIWRSDGAGDTQFEADKGAISDALKRSAVAFGVGRHLYDLPDNMWVNCESKVVNGKAYFKKFTENPLDVLRRKRADFR